MIWQYLPTFALCEVYACVVTLPMSPPTPKAIREALVRQLGEGSEDITLFIGDKGRTVRQITDSEMLLPLGMVRPVIYFQRPVPSGARTLYPTVKEYMSRDRNAMALTNRFASLLQ